MHEELHNEIANALKKRGHKIGEPYIKAPEGRLFLVIDGVAMTVKNAERVATGQATVDQIASEIAIADAAHSRVQWGQVHRFVDAAGTHTTAGAFVIEDEPGGRYTGWVTKHPNYKEVHATSFETAADGAMALMREAFPHECTGSCDRTWTEGILHGDPAANRRAK